MSINRIQWIFSKEYRIQYIYAIAIQPVVFYHDMFYDGMSTQVQVDCTVRAVLQERG